MRNSYGQTLSYQLRQLGPARNFSANDVILEGEHTLAFSLGSYPGEDWTQFNVPLRESASWMCEETHRPVTRAQFVRTLKSLAAIRLRGEYAVGPDLTELDNVRIHSSHSRSFQ